MPKKEYTGVNITTPACRLAFPQVFQKRLNELSGKEEYSVTMLFPKDSTDMKPLKQAMVKAAKNEFGADVDLKSLDLARLKDGDEMDRSEYKGNWVVKAKTTLGQPGVVDGQLNEIIDPSEIYSGVWAKVNITAKGYSKGDPGVTFYLQHIQKIKDDEPFAGGPRSKDVFDEIEIDEDDIESTAGTEDADVEDADALFS